MLNDILKNGLTISTEECKDDDFVTIAFRVNKGSIDEKIDEIGIAHLVEHMVFKGTVNRTSDEIWKDIGRYGGDLNAFTSEKMTCFYCTMLKEYADVALDVLADIVFNNTLEEDEFELEKSVVVEELYMYKDDGHTMAHDLIAKTVFKDIRNRYNVGGTPETVSKITLSQVKDFVSRNYIPKNIQIVSTGNIEHSKIVDFMNKYIEDYEFVEESPNYREEIKELNLEDSMEDIDGGQSHLMAYFPIEKFDLKTLYISEILNQILAGGIGSKLSIIREKYGYAYVVRPEMINMDNLTIFNFYVGLNFKNVEKTKELINSILQELINDGITDDEFETSKNKQLFDLKEWEILSRRKNAIKIRCLDDDLTLELTDHINCINEITIDEVNEFVKENFDLSKLHFAIMKQTKGTNE